MSIQSIYLNFSWQNHYENEVKNELCVVDLIFKGALKEINIPIPSNEFYADNLQFVQKEYWDCSRNKSTYLPKVLKDKSVRNWTEMTIEELFNLTIYAKTLKNQSYKESDIPVIIPLDLEIGNAYNFQIIANSQRKIIAQLIRNDDEVVEEQLYNSECAYEKLYCNDFYEFY